MLTRLPGVGEALGPYRIARELGAGGMGVVFEAVEQGLGRRVALKVLAVQLADEPEFRARFVREATVLARSDSPHIIQVYSHGEQDGCLYLATQFVPGGDLAARVATEGVPTPEIALEIAAQVATALADAHAVGVIHRDVKPHNVLLRPGQGQVHAYLCDFGIARDDESALTATGVVAGTYAYLAPERFRGEPATPLSDVYALGCLLWFLLTGRPPYDGGLVQLAQQHELAAVPQLPGAPERLNSFLRRSMAKDPADRPPSAAAAAAELRAIRAGGGAGRPAPTPPSPPASPVRRRRRPLRLVAASAAALVLAAGAALTWHLSRDDAGARDDPGAREDPGARADTSASVDRDRPPGAAALSTGDVDGDGTDDTILVDAAADATLVLRSDPDSDSGFGDLHTWSGTAHGSAKLVRGDFTGDGRADLAVVEPGGVRVAASTGEGFEEPGPRASWTLPDDFRVSVGDFDADGLDDLALVTEGEETGVLVEVARSGDDGFGALQRWTFVDAVLDDLKVGTADMDGDGRADLVAMGRLGEGVDVRVLRSLGDSFAKAQTWRAQPGWSWVGTRPLLGDVDGDGRSDLVALRDVGSLRVEVLRSDGDRLLPDDAVSDFDDLDLDRTRSVAADTDGDGTTDLVLGDRGVGEVRQLHHDGESFQETGRVPVEASIDQDGSILVSATR